MTQFEPWPKIPRLRREITITEKIDGTNAQVCIVPGVEFVGPECILDQVTFTDIDSDLVVLCGSRTRWITPGKQTDNFGFAGWAQDNAQDLIKLGVGRHYGEWWGNGIHRGYGLKEKRFSLFNTARPVETLPDCVDQVPLIFKGIDDGGAVEDALDHLRIHGSLASSGFMKPEGIVVYHSAARSRFKVLLEGDDQPKGN